jgi:hypothetical protein
MILDRVLGEEHLAREFPGVGPGDQMADQFALACAEGECPGEQGDPLWRQGLLDGDGDVVLLAESFLRFLQANVWSSPGNAPALIGTPQTRILELTQTS